MGEPGPVQADQSRRRNGPGSRDTAVSRAAMLSCASLDAAFPGRGSISRTSSVLSQVTRFGQKPMPPLYVATALSFPDAENTIVASRSTTVTPVSSRPATLSQGNPSGRAASRDHQCRRNPVTAVLSRASCRSPASDRARHTVGVEGTGPVSGARCASAWKSLIASPPAISTRARSVRSWPRSCNGLEPRRRIAAESPARSPVRSASSRNGSSPAQATSRSSSPVSSRPAAHEVPCTEEVHPPQPDRGPRQIAFWLVRCTSPLFRAVHARRVANPDERRRPSSP